LFRLEATARPVECAGRQVQAPFAREAGHPILNTKTVALTLGWTLLIAGALGLILSATGLFVIGMNYNLAHLVGGQVLILTVFGNFGPALRLKIVGLAYILLSVLRLIFDDSSSTVPWLDIGLGVVMLAAAFLLPDEKDEPAAT
jgi:hypothetical protein